MDPITEDQINDWFGYHPANDTTGPLHDKTRANFLALAQELRYRLPAGADRTLAIRKLQEAMWAANSAIACSRELQGV